MNTTEMARHCVLSERTIRRYARFGILSPRRSMLGAYIFGGDDIDQALIARARKQRKLEAVSPGLARYQRRRREHSSGSQGHRQRSLGGSGDTMQRLRFPRCGHLHRLAEFE